MTFFAGLSNSSLLARLAAIGIIVGGVVASFAYTGGWLTPRALTPSVIVDTFEHVNGPHPGFRRNHAKGVCVKGYFESNGQGAEISKAVVFAAGRTSVVGRFALAGGQPYAADAPMAVRSMALLFKLANGEEWRTGINNIPVFAVKSAEGFRDLLLASAPLAQTGKPDPAKMDAFFAQYPESLAAVKLIKANPVSSGFENSAYNSLNAFQMVDAKGKATAVRWAMVPLQPVEPAGAKPADAKNYLFDALAAKLHEHPLQWRLIISIGQPGDPTNDATVPWPADRRQVDAGTLTIDGIESEDTSPVRDINFDPLILPEGIAGSDDPLLSARSAAYSHSFTRREGERKSPSAVSPSEMAKPQQP